MKVILVLLFLGIVCMLACANSWSVQNYVGSTPPHATIKNFLGIPATDSIDFIRWKLETGPATYSLDCRYGRSKPGTPGFMDEQKTSFKGKIIQRGDHLYLAHRDKSLAFLKVNKNILHFLDAFDQLLPGNGGYSYALNNTQPVKTGAVNLRFVPSNNSGPMIFEGRTPCGELPAMLGLQHPDACIKMKWYFIFYTDSLTGKPTYFNMAGNGFMKAAMARGKWQIITQPNGRIIYRLDADIWKQPLHLLKGDDTVLFFTGIDGQPLVGNEDFSFTLNRKTE